MLANGCRCNVQRCSKHDERRLWYWCCGFLPRVTGGHYHVTHVDPCAVCLLDLQASAGRHLLGAVPTRNVCFAVGHPHQRAAHVHSRNRFLETMLRHLCPSRNPCRCMPSHGPQLPSVGYGGSPRVQHTWQHFLGCQLLRWQKLVHLPDSLEGLGHPDHLHLGRLRLHVCRCLPSHEPAQEVGSEVEKYSQGPELDELGSATEIFFMPFVRSWL